MPTTKNRTRELSPSYDVAKCLAELKRLATSKTRTEMATRYGIITDKAFGVKVGDIQSVAKKIGTHHELAAKLWATGWYEARMLASFIDDADLVTPAQMDRWRRDFDNWGICDTVCFKLFDRTPHAMSKVRQWAKLTDEFGKRAAFALLACVALHNKSVADEELVRCLPLIGKAATDERNFVKKGVSWALRAVGSRTALRSAATALAEQLADSDVPAARWIGRDALRDFRKSRSR